MKSALALSTLLLPSALAKGSLKSEPVEGLCDTTVKSQSGYYHVESGNDKNYFYWLFESRDTPSTDPLIMWLNGGIITLNIFCFHLDIITLFCI